MYVILKHKVTGELKHLVRGLTPADIIIYLSCLLLEHKLQSVALTPLLLYVPFIWGARVINLNNHIEAGWEIRE